MPFGFFENMKERGFESIIMMIDDKIDERAEVSVRLIDRIITIFAAR